MALLQPLILGYQSALYHVQGGLLGSQAPVLIETFISVGITLQRYAGFVPYLSKK